MKHADFVHLHVHTQYSLLDGACLIKPLLKAAQTMNMPALAITDHGNLFGAIEFYTEAMALGIKPIIGCEVYMAPGSRFEKSSHGIHDAAFHLILLAQNETGYRNLVRLVSIGYLEGFYYRPRIDKDVLFKHAAGLICLTACLKGEVPHLLLAGQKDQARATVSEMRDAFGRDNLYIELQSNGIPEQDQVNRELITLARSLEIPLVATNDVHYLAKDHASAHEALLCIQTQTTLDDPDRMRFQTDEFYLKPPAVMKDRFAEVPEAIKNSLAIAEKCTLELDFKKTYLPQYIPPDGKTQEQSLAALCEEGLTRIYGEAPPEVRERLVYELEVIKKSGFISYFLITWDFVNYAKNKGIPVGPGRGSAAGSLVSYALGITNINPLRYDLLFERFLNPGRISMPDIDIDFCYERRGEVISYVTEKYGADRVAQIITFGTMQAKAVVRDVARVMGFAYAEADRIAKLIPNDLEMTLERALEVEPELKKLYQTDTRVTQLIDTSMVLEGVTRHASTHAAGVVISAEPLLDIVPLFKTNEDQITTGYAMTSLEKVGVLKMDFLGLRTLTVIAEAVKIVKRVKGADVDINTLPLEDEKTFALLCDAQTHGIFQVESSGMRDLLKKLKPEKFEDLIALLALYRPGPIGSGMLDDFIKRKHGQVKIQYDHPSLEPILKETYGIIVYQEQVMRIAGVLAKFSMSEADGLRKAIGKKIPEVLAEARARFIAGATDNKIPQKTAEKIFNQIEYFGGYGFNKSHSAAYALISYQTAYLKANFPVEFMAALLTSEKDNTDKIALYIGEAQRMGIQVLPPDVNESFANFTVVPASGADAEHTQHAIRFGLAAIKNVGRTAIDSIIQARKTKGKFASLYEFAGRIDSRVVNRKVIESLIKCGAFDSMGFYRSQLTAIVDKALEVAADVNKDRSNGQLSFFETFEHQDSFRNTFQEIPRIPEWPESQLLSYEKQLLGFYVSSHPLASCAKVLKTYATHTIKHLGSLTDGAEVFIGGIIDKVKMTVTKKTNERMAIFLFEDLGGTAEALVFPSSFQKCGHLVKPDSIVFVRARVSLREDKPKLLVGEIIPIEEVKSRFTQSISITLRTTGLERYVLEELKDLCKRHAGDVPMYLTFIGTNGQRVTMQSSDDFRVFPSDEFAEKIQRLLGEDAFQLNPKKNLYAAA